MKVLNVHERKLQASAERVGALIDSLSSPRDVLWPTLSWPRMIFDRPLGIGATGGHGPIRYFVEQYVPGRSVRFRFIGPKGFDGYHGFEVIPSGDGACVLRHTLKMRTHGPALLSWPLVYRPLHDALIEDSLAVAAISLSLPPLVQRWALRVRVLRWLVSGGRAAPQSVRLSAATAH